MSTLPLSMNDRSGASLWMKVQRPARVVSAGLLDHRSGDVHADHGVHMVSERHRQPPDPAAEVERERAPGRAPRAAASASARDTSAVPVSVERLRVPTAVDVGRDRPRWPTSGRRTPGRSSRRAPGPGQTGMDRTWRGARRRIRWCLASRSVRRRWSPGGSRPIAPIMLEQGCGHSDDTAQAQGHARIDRTVMRVRPRRGGREVTSWYVSNVSRPASLSTHARTKRGGLST